MSQPITREEQYLSAMASGNSTDIKPVTREDIYLAKATGQSVAIPEPITRKEVFLRDIALNGSGGGSVILKPFTLTKGGNYKAVDYDADGFSSVFADVDPAPIWDESFTITGDPDDEGGTCDSPLAYHLTSADELPEDAVDGSLAVVGEEFYIREKGKWVKGGSNLPSDAVICTLVDTVNIGEGAFIGSKALTSIDLPLATSIGDRAFNSCTALTSIDFPLATSIGEGAFYRCTALTSIDLPNAMSIGYETFAFCSVLTSINLPLATSIGQDAFRYCSALTSIDLPNAMSIGKVSFYRCTALTSIDLPNAMSIGNEAFSSCTALTSIDLPNAMSISNLAFSSCTSFDTLILRNTETVCNLMVSALFDTKILTAEGMPTGEGFVYVPTVLYEQYVSNLVAQVMTMGYDEATATYLVTAVLRKIEDYPEICG